MIFVPALVGAFLPQTRSAIFKKYAVLPPAREKKKYPSSYLEKDSYPDFFFAWNL
jgi:hypothetical protein